MAITGSQPSYMYALGGYARGGATRGGDTDPRTYITIAGVQVGTLPAVATQYVLGDTLSIVETEGDTPNTASFQVKGFQPTDGQEVIITQGSKNNLDRLFAGTILTDAHNYVGTPANYSDQIHAIDYTWLLTRRTISQKWTSTSATTIAQAIIANCPGFSSLLVASGLATLDEFSVTNQTLAAALSALCDRIGATWKATYASTVSGMRADVRLAITNDTTLTDPTTLTAASSLLTGMTDFSVTRDLSQVITRQPVEGGGSTAFADLSAGETSLPVTDTPWYNTGGGTVVSGPQRITYTGVQAGGGGALVGPGISPSAAPSLALAAGTGLGNGVYQYAYTDVTAAGESLPSPLATIATVDPPTPSTPVDSGDWAFFSTSALGSPGDAISYKVTFGMGTSASDYTQESVPSAAMTSTLTAAGGGLCKPKLVTLTYSSDPNVKWVRLWASDPNILAGAYAQARLFIDSTNTSIPGASGNSIPNVTGTGTVTAVDMTARTSSPALPAGSAHYAQVALSAVALGPTGVTARKIYRTALGGSQLKLQQTIANNTATTSVTDATADGSLGANVPTSDTSGLTQPTGQVNAGSTTLLLAGAGAFSSGWAIVGSQGIKYTGVTGNTLTGIPASGAGSIGATIPYNTTVVAAAALTGIPASGVGSILYAIKQGDPVNLRVVIDDVAAQSVIAALMLPTVDDGIIEGAVMQDGRISETEARARGTAQLALRSAIDVAVTYSTRDKNTHASRTIAVSLVAPTSVSSSFKLQSVTIDTFTPALWPIAHAHGANKRVTLDDLLRTVKGA